MSCGLEGPVTYPFTEDSAAFHEGLPRVGQLLTPSSCTDGRLSHVYVLDTENRSDEKSGQTPPSHGVYILAAGRRKTEKKNQLSDHEGSEATGDRKAALDGAVRSRHLNGVLNNEKSCSWEDSEEGITSNRSGRCKGPEARESLTC